MRIIGANKTFDVDVNLVGSKSESNRALMIAYYGGFAPRIKNMSASDDTRLLYEIINGFTVKKRFIASHINPNNPINSKTINCANAGTVLRFLATALAFRDGNWILTGSDRMLQRPIGDLVNALRTMGADIEYMGQEGFPPLKINGKSPVRTDRVCPKKIRVCPDIIHVDISRSSQFASSILLALPVVGTRCATSKIHLDGDLSSVPYIDMTIDIMQKFGIDVHREGRDIFIQPSEYQDVECAVESDWTCASYWYEIVAFSENGRARLRNLHLDSKQGDAIVAKWFENFGVKSIQDGDDVVITRFGTRHATSLQFDFTNNPDLYPTIAATCAGLGVNAHFTGLQNLKYKESDRVAVMTTELSKKNIVDSHNDHRIAMALAPLAIKIGTIEINNADVVSKSYPNFWNDIQSVISTEAVRRSGEISSK